MKQYFLVVDFNGVSEDIKTECLRYAGLKSDDYLFEVTDGQAFRPPKGILFHPWATMNIERMATFGVKAKKVLGDRGSRPDKMFRFHNSN